MLFEHYVNNQTYQPQKGQSMPTRDKLNKIENTPRIFLCHASEDKLRVQKLYQQLKEAGYHPWLDKEDLLPGQHWLTEIQKIIGDPYNLVMVCLSSKSTTKRGTVQREITKALDVLDGIPENTIYLIPARLEPCEVPDRLSNLHWVDLFEPNGFEYLKRALDYEISRRRSESEPNNQKNPNDLSKPSASQIKKNTSKDTQVGTLQSKGKSTEGTDPQNPVKETQSVPGKKSWARLSDPIVIGLIISTFACIAAWLALPQIQGMITTFTPQQSVIAQITSTSTSPDTASPTLTAILALTASASTPTLIYAAIKTSAPTSTATPRPTSTPTPTDTPDAEATANAKATQIRMAELTQTASAPTAGSSPTLTPSPTSLPTETSTPTPTPTLAINGRIAFTSNRDGVGNWEVYVMNANGSNQVNLTNNPAVDWWPTWSPDGQRIAFVSDRDGNFEIYVMNADGSGQTRLTDNAADDRTPAWSPDGQRIAFSSNRDGYFEIYVMTIDGTSQSRLTTKKDHTWAPDWTSDGNQLIYYSDYGSVEKINVDGSNQITLRNHTSNNYLDPSLSPDNHHIATTVREYLGPPEIYVINIDNSTDIQLTDDATEDRDPSWSPDGKYIAFSSERGGNFEIYVMNTDGSNPTNLTNNSSSDWWPAWKP